MLSNSMRSTNGDILQKFDIIHFMGKGKKKFQTIIPKKYASYLNYLCNQTERRKAHIEDNNRCKHSVFAIWNQGLVLLLEISV